MIHPRAALFVTPPATVLPVCDHYCGTEARMIKSLALQSELAHEFGSCVFDVTLDCEDGALVGRENEHALMVLGLIKQALNATESEASNTLSRIAVRVHPVDHHAFSHDIAVIVGGAAKTLCHVMIPKVESVADVNRAALAVDQASQLAGRKTPLPLHVLIESPLALHHVASIVSHPRVQSASFGLMDFVSAHDGLIPLSAMQTSAHSCIGNLDQFTHPLVVRAKLEIAATCHAFGKTASHCVVTEFKNTLLLESAARRASRAFGFGRMWSIHPDQIRPILKAFAPDTAEVEQASHIICAAASADWAPISVDGVLHDRASYRYFWQTLVRAHQTALLPITDPASQFFS